ncbi:hypothetical protein U8P76_10750 [Rhizobium johnstonii]|uniref:hypothetical protein n=1 Tax=Rhizobium leguminosarum TaxID=384 RepID=UPI00103094A9|nr:hypothetical protein [Rhizobium leguminosarum]TBG20627.1 hypothetical protein ELG81_08710 [Rhizobium leguminosarum]TBG46543.1 hypothetical protein ELG75_08725 [Rhizobium leguminosarum]TBG79514.1 hypothetical protein ELG76_09060 [Rhizobium leguminosarum]WSG97228.1 hypothetical protein U8P76_10750 [Rhizobium johnstonii]
MNAIANDNQADINRRDEIARGLCSERALRMLEALPALLKHDTVDELERDALEAVENYDRAIQAIDAHFSVPEHDRTSEAAETLIRREYLARRSLAIYQAEIALRAREAAAGVH